ncbi:MAG: AarF/ABC1/UbiB kinase family protein, partial [Conexibacter sp.]|nr:AarF/ABC1/UbiB kinase family protein [Conexibacter sp.]
MARDARIPTSRWARAAKVGRLAATQGAKQAATRAVNLTRDEQAAQDAMARRQVETAKQIVAALGTMKGAAMKLGQVMSFLDVGLVPEEFREEFQAELAKLRDAAPKVSFKDMKKVLEQEYGEKLEDV